MKKEMLNKRVDAGNYKRWIGQYSTKMSLRSFIGGGVQINKVCAAPSAKKNNVEITIFHQRALKSI